MKKFADVNEVLWLVSYCEVGDLQKLNEEHYIWMHVSHKMCCNSPESIFPDTSYYWCCISVMICISSLLLAWIQLLPSFHHVFYLFVLILDFC